MFPVEQSELGGPASAELIDGWFAGYREGAGGELRLTCVPPDDGAFGGAVTDVELYMLLLLTHEKGCAHDPEP